MPADAPSGHIPLFSGLLETKAEEAAALGAVGTAGAADKGAIERFGTWAIATVKSGATSGAVAVISSAVTTLLTHLAHLG